MRLWHKDLIKVLPTQQLLGQWRECCLVAKLVYENFTPNHILVNKVTRYPKEHLWKYGRRVYNEMLRRGYHADWSKFSKWFNVLSAEYEYDDIFHSWHNDRYYKQCYFNLQEKYDCGGISDEEWELIRINKWED